MASRPATIRRVVEELENFSQHLFQMRHGNTTFESDTLAAGDPGKGDFIYIIEKSQETVQAVKESVEEVLDNQRFTNLENTMRFQTLESTVDVLDEADNMFDGMLDAWDDDSDTHQEDCEEAINDVCQQLQCAEFPPMMPGGGRKRKVKQQPKPFVNKENQHKGLLERFNGDEEAVKKHLAEQEEKRRLEDLEFEELKKRYEEKAKVIMRERLDRLVKREMNSTGWKWWSTEEDVREWIKSRHPEFRSY